MRKAVIGDAVDSGYELAKTQGCLKGSRQNILSHEKTAPSKIRFKTVLPRKFFTFLGFPKRQDFCGKNCSIRELPVHT